MKLVDDQDRHKIDFKFGPDQTIQYNGEKCQADRAFIGLATYFQKTKTGIKFPMSLKFD